MPQDYPKINTIAPLQNIGLLMSATRRAMDYCQSNSGMFVVFHGHAGYGKTMACNYVRGKVNGYRVEVLSHWTRKALLQAILYEMAIPQTGNISAMFTAIAQQLAASRRPLILDEADHLVKGSSLEMVRNLMDQSGVPVILAGEEMLPQKLKRWERIDSRVLEPVAAVPADLEDIRTLAQLYCPDVDIADDWLAELHAQTGGNTRRVVVNLNQARTKAPLLGGVITIKSWGDIGWYTKARPMPRKAV